MIFQSTLIVGKDSQDRERYAYQLAQGLIGQTSLEHPDCYLIKKTNNVIGIDSVRALTQFLSLKPFQSQNKVTLIVEAQDLTLPGQNALLKTLEEPPQNSFLILTAPNPDSLISTICSRCQIIRLGNKNAQLAEEQTKEILTNLLYLSSTDRLIFLKEHLTVFEEGFDHLFSQSLPFWQDIILTRLGIEKNDDLQLQDIVQNLTQPELAQICRQIQNNQQLQELGVDKRLLWENFLINLPEIKNRDKN